jgi:hypothetical protein
MAQSIDDSMLEDFRRKIDRFEAGKDKYVYFLLAAVGAAVGFAMHSTATTPFDGRHWIWLLAILFWGVSFVAGCKNRLLDLHLGVESLVPDILMNAARLEASALDITEESKAQAFKRIDAFVDGQRKERHNVLKTAEFWLKMQFHFLVAGGAAFVIWHIFGMVSR